MIISFILNGEDVNARVRSGDLLVDLLRETFGLLSTKADCRGGSCGKCLVLLGGRLVPSCVVPAFKVKGREVVTLEGYALTDDYGDIRQGLEESGLRTCGYCEGATILTLASLVEKKRRPSSEELSSFLSVLGCGCVDLESLKQAALAALDARARRLYHRAR